jgi:hypothetical protein
VPVRSPSAALLRTLMELARALRRRWESPSQLRPALAVSLRRARPALARLPNRRLTTARRA